MIFLKCVYFDSIMSGLFQLFSSSFRSSKASSSKPSFLKCRARQTFHIFERQKDDWIPTLIFFQLLASKSVQNKRYLVIFTARSSGLTFRNPLGGFRNKHPFRHRATVHGNAKSSPPGRLSFLLISQLVGKQPGGLLHFLFSFLCNCGA